MASFSAAANLCAAFFSSTGNDLGIGRHITCRGGAQFVAPRGHPSCLLNVSLETKRTNVFGHSRRRSVGAQSLHAHEEANRLPKPFLQATFNFLRKIAPAFNWKIGAVSARGTGFRSKGNRPVDWSLFQRQKKILTLLNANHAAPRLLI